MISRAEPDLHACPTSSGGSAIHLLRPLLTYIIARHYHYAALRQVIGLSFHPDGNKLAAAAGTILYIWDFEKDAAPQTILQTKVSWIVRLLK